MSKKIIGCVVGSGFPIFRFPKSFPSSANLVELTPFKSRALKVASQSRKGTRSSSPQFKFLEKSGESEMVIVT